MFTLNETPDQIAARFAKNFDAPNFIMVNIPSHRKHWTKACISMFSEFEKQYGIRLIASTDCFPNFEGNYPHFEEYRKIYGPIPDGEFHYTFTLFATNEYELEIIRRILKDEKIMKRIIK